MVKTLRKQTTLRLETVLPASKSISNRALVVSALAGSAQLRNISDCDDSRVVVKALAEKVGETDGVRVIDIGAAGTAMRFLTAYLSVTKGEYIITGTERMRNRPITILVDALRQLGADIQYVEKEGFPPLRISGHPLEGGEISLKGNVSSQYISALLMVGPTMTKGLALHLEGEIVSRPYIEMTLAIMTEFGAKVERSNERDIRVNCCRYNPVPYLIENDWSGASYWYEMMCLAEDEMAEVLLPGLFGKSLQGDSRIRDYFEPLGVKTTFMEKDGMPCVRLQKSGSIAERLDLDLVNQPDLAQTLVCTCCFKGVSFRFTGLQSLKIKETDRIFALRTELRKLGYDVSEEKDSVLYWNGERIEPTGEAIDTYEDHRMAMAFAPACFVRDEVKINNPQVVTKSYPTFWDEFPQGNGRTEKS